MPCHSYVDGARFLPDNITLSKVSVKLMNPDFEPLQTPTFQICELDTDLRSPMYNLHAEFRDEKYNPAGEWPRTGVLMSRLPGVLTSPAVLCGSRDCPLEQQRSCCVWTRWKVTHTSSRWRGMVC